MASGSARMPLRVFSETLKQNVRYGNLRVFAVKDATGPCFYAEKNPDNSETGLNNITSRQCLPDKKESKCASVWLLNA